MGICNPAKHRQTPHTSRQAQKDAQTLCEGRGGAGQGERCREGGVVGGGCGRVRGFF